ncbi:MAG TPA: MotA/TolQ/ExbB proton channel family protein [Bacteroidetes bacterium]|nr:MotA/TolQ/ExbB proton channel family protein [Bacteroidota bacterium]
MLLLQANPALSDSLAAGTAAPEMVKESFFDTLVQGGWTMVPIVALFFLAIYILVERYLTVRKADADTTQFMTTIRSYIHSGNLDQAKQYCIQENSPFARMILKGLNRLGSPMRDIASAIEAVGNLEIYQLEKRLGILATIAGAAPMLGFFGTVLGMIGAFGTIAKAHGAISPEKLAGPISTAMVTTAAGLAVGVVAYLGYNYLVNLVGRVIYKMEATSTDFADLLLEPAAPSNSDK